MATDYFSDCGTSGSPYVASSPTETPFYTPRLALSRRTSRYGTSSPGPSSSPPPLPADAPDLADDDNVSILDPRRFTPTLQASLVSEILSLRRDLESKIKFIENLEDDLHGARTDNESLSDELAQAIRDSRIAETRFEESEKETLSALANISNEREELKRTTVDLKDKLEASQKKIRTQEDDSDRVHELWEKERKTWNDEKRQLERRVHVTEARLRTIVTELAAHEEATHEPGASSEAEDNAHDSGLGNESDTTSVRSVSRYSCSRNGRHARNTSLCSSISIAHVQRYSLQTPTGSPMRGKFGSMTLADELVFDEDAEDMEELELDSDDFPENEMRARRALESRQSTYQDDKAKRILGLMEDDTKFTTLAYIDTGVQFSPPSSPQLALKMGLLEGAFEPRPLSKDIEANQRRKRISINTSDSPSRFMHQTSLAEPEKPPATPKISTPPSPEVPPANSMPIPTAEYCSTSTQTEPSSSPEAKITAPVVSTRAPPPPPIPVPSITIHPPQSAPTSPKEPILPPGTKNAECQTTFNLSAFTRSVSMQTEEILVDRRLNKLPPHLRPSAIKSRPTSLEPEIQQARHIQLGPLQKAPPQPQVMRPARDASHAKHLMSTARIENRYPGNNDNGPLTYDSREIPSRPFRTSSLFAGFDGASSDEGDEFGAAEFSDDEHRRAPLIHSSNRTQKHSRPLANIPTPVPEEREPSPDARQMDGGPSKGRLSGSRRSSPEKASRVSKPVRVPTLTRQPSIRRAAMIQSGTAAHFQQRSRTPSLASLESSVQSSATRPPFPVPTRSSSRKLPMSKSEGAQSPTPRGGFPKRTQGQREHDRGDGLRKVRSAAVIPRGEQGEGRRRPSSPQKPPSPRRKPNPQLPPLPNQDLTSSTYIYSSKRFSHRSQPSQGTAQTGTESTVSSTQPTTVVDAIAATMVGEWMWKYVRKRKSFGIQDSAQDTGQPGVDGTVNVAIGGVRHKRWVWLSPYERSVMWSSKQPTSESALLGKSGRKLVIQSVLDVKDNTPSPKNSGIPPLFDRSILILTPARALKFTAISKERHYLWLTALSFLAHSSVSPPVLASLPVVVPQPPEDTSRSQAPTLRRGNFGNSGRIPTPKPSAPPLRQQYSSPAAPSRENPDTSLLNHAEPIPDSAEPPVVPRYGGGSLHGRKRSSTGPRLPPPPGSTFRSFSHTAVPSISTFSTGSSNTPSNPSSVYNSNLSGRTSEASSSNRRSQNFFDAVGLVRMDAFIEPMLSEEAVHGPRSPAIGHHGSGGGAVTPRISRRRGISHLSQSTNASWRNGGWAIRDGAS
ncbi:hypothetical protein H2199_000701 [Coniosporium tulheliwenetii]|uniref:Uncharacterized protein n=1 Tax=Coniosporium tulheliwenetii TaxID=3383036 RepID=A0ACC2ZMJ9_9PEZI|nr:hypothetical protein H2199_000701 [Cladosporium sp. JES 115]